MPDRNPLEETMRAGQMNVPQRTVRPTMRDVAGPVRTHEAAHQGVRTGFGGGPIGYYEDPTGPTRPPGQPMSGRHIGYGGPRPIRAGFGGGPIMGYEGAGIFGGQRASGANDMVNAMMGGMDTSRLQRENEQAGISPHDWRRMWKLQQMGIDPTPHIDAAKYGPNPFPGPLDGGLPPTSPGPFYPGGPGEGWDQAERSTDFGSDWRGQQMLYDRIIQANPGLGEDELMILFQQAMDQATA